MTKKTQRNVLMPFRVEKSGHITITATLSGKEARLIVDTGAGGTCIDVAALERFDLRLSRRSRKGGGVGSSSMQLTRVAKHDLAVAGISLSQFSMHALDLSHVNAALAAEKVKPIVGVLGADVLLDRQATIDYGRGHLIIAEESRGEG